MTTSPGNSTLSRWTMVGAGGLLLVLSGLLLFGPGGKKVQGAEPVLDGAAVQTTEKLLLSVTVNNPDDKKLSGALKVELLDADNKVVASKEQDIAQTEKTGVYRFEMTGIKQPHDKLTLQYTLGKHKVLAPLSKKLLVKAHETVLTSSTEFHSGTTASLRCSVHGVKSLTETIPLPKATIEVRLRDKAGKVYELYKGEAGADGVAAPKIQVPSLPTGTYKMEVATKSALGEEKLERDIKVKAEPKVLLITDKPLYQPGQLIHIRALCLGAFDLKPVAESTLIFEVEDSKGNKVFKREHKTSAQGIASVDFQLASEVNQGDYKVRALLGDKHAEKNVTVKPYVLPKFKSNLTADKKFYLPKETIKADLQADYFFGKPVAKSKYKVTASTFDVAFKEFMTHQGETDEQGHAKFDIKLPDYFVGTPLASGNAIVKLEIKLTDTADHTETITKTYTVSDKPIRVSLLPEAGRLIPGVENRVFAAALSPDGSPIKCEVELWHVKDIKDKFIDKIKTGDNGLAEFRFTPDEKLFRQGEHVQHNIEMLGGTQQVWGPKSFLDLKVIAKEDKGQKVETQVALTSDLVGNNVLLRLNKAIYKGGDTMEIDVRSTAGTPTVFIDLVRDGQTLLTKWLDVKDGKAGHKIDLPPEVFGTVEVHAYQMLADGVIVRDGRVVYVQPSDELKIAVKADKDTYLPGEEGKIRFEVTDQAGKPTAAALGVVIVDEAVYALQEMQPGLEKVYFTLQQELLKPQVQVNYKPGESIDNLVVQPALDAERQQVAQALMCALHPKAPEAWNVNPALGRKQKFEQVVYHVGSQLFNQASAGKQYLERDGKTWRFKADVMEDLFKSGALPKEMKSDPFGQPLTMATILAMDSEFTANNFARMLTTYRIQDHMTQIVNDSQARQATLLKDGKWTFPDGYLESIQKKHKIAEYWLHDGWGKAVRFIKTSKKVDHKTPYTQFDFYQVVSAGPDGEFGTDDDFRFGDKSEWKWTEDWLAHGQARLTGEPLRDMRRWGRDQMLRNRTDFQMERGGFGPGGFPPAMMPMAGGAGDFRNLAKDAKETVMPKQGGLPQDLSTFTGKADGGTAPITRMREYFPETMLWKPAVITDDKGIAILNVPFADSITTWRLTASASSNRGHLGGMTTPLRVFQDFFVDLDLPITLTQNDEVSFPVAVFNYMKDPQTVKLQLVEEPWFELVDGKAERSLDIKSGEVKGIAYRIRAKKLGHQPLTVKAHGSKMSDAIKRVIEVLPDGQMKENVVNSQLAGKNKHSLVIPGNAIPDASKMFVKVYPGVFSQIVEGVDGILRMPGGCFEQTSSSAYPNILVVDYIKKMKLTTPEILMKAETYLNAGYQRLLTFERPGGGFDWWGSGPPLVWLSAYGLQEFNDMSKVWPIDRAIIDRTQKWLMSQRGPDGTWSNIGATHGESIERMGDPKLLLTSYVVWALADSGFKGKELQSSIDFIRAESKKATSPYILALAGNALASWDANDDSTLEVLKKLATLKKDLPEQKALCFPVAGGQSLSYARGDGLTVETTALSAMAMMKSKQFSADANKALMYLVKSKDAHGTWGSTQATILALKALVMGAGGVQPKESAKFTVLVGGKKVAVGEVNEKNSDVLQQFDLTTHVQAGNNEVSVEVSNETAMMYQVVARHFEPWVTKEVKKPVIDVSVEYDRTRLSTSDLLKAKATLKYNGEVPTYNVIVDLGIAPGFTVDGGDFAEMVAAKKVQKFTITARQVTLYLGDVKPGDVLTFEYGMKPKYPLKAKTPSTVAYEYYTPTNRAESKPVELTVEEKK